MRCPSTRIFNLSAHLGEQESNVSSSGDREAPAVAHVCERLRPHLATLMGNVGFQALLWRAVAVAGAGDERLTNLRITPQGTFEGWEAAGLGERIGGGTALTAHLLTLLESFIGKNLTFRIVCEAWPELTLDLFDPSIDEDHEA